MGVKEEIAQGAIRVSLGWGTEPEHVERFIEAWGALIERLKEARKAA
jgi:cysteine sulfinate desulfinase/cysteine desulfurase-like protein